MKTIKPYDENPVNPAYKMPAGACDSHCHVFGPANHFPYSPVSTYTPKDAGFETLRALHDHLGIERAVIVQASCHGTDNRAMMDAIARSNGRYRGVGMVGGDVTDAELEALHLGGVRGIRYNFVAHLGGAPDPDVFDRMVNRVKGLGWHVVLHLDAQDIPYYLPLLNSLPIPFIIDHMGRAKVADGIKQPPFQELLALMRNNERSWVKISGAERISKAGRPFADAIPFASALIKAAPDRVLWGTDFPHPNISGDMPNDGELVDLFARFTDNDDLRTRILVDNPERLYWAD
ncbi:amidohydrolase family protein [Marinobacter sp. M5B]|uniref:amidohydrolase family protein n=1 Tax=Marinobacter sp. M5B TaxID=3141535 RepID=UPI0036D25D94